jgi:hypothetical protein
MDVGVDGLVVMPLLLLPIFFLWLALVRGGSLSESVCVCVRERDYWTEVRPILHVGSSGIDMNTNKQTSIDQSISPSIPS